MVIYSHNLHAKLFGYAISREFIKYQSPYCEHLDDPALALDFDLAINFNQAINGNKDALNAFVTTFVLSGASIDIPTKKFYRQKMETYPIFEPQIAFINYTFANLNSLNTPLAHSIRNANDCLTSPCNPFGSTSSSISKLSQGSIFSNENSVFAVGNMKDNTAIFTGGIDATLFNKIPEVFQKSIVNLKTLALQAWSETQTSMVDAVNKTTLENLAHNGSSMRLNTAGYRYTPDYASHITLNKIAADILAETAAELGDCFRDYQHDYRYNPYDPKQNLENVSRSPIPDTVNSSNPTAGMFSRTLFGQSPSNSGGSNTDNLDYGGRGNRQPEPTQYIVNVATTGPITFVTDGAPTPAKNNIMIYGGHLNGTTFYKNATNSSDTQRGILKARRKDKTGDNDQYKTGPANWELYKQLKAQGYTTSSDLMKFEDKKFNIGIAIDPSVLKSYFTSSGGFSYNIGDIEQYISNTGKSDKRVFARIKPDNGGSETIIKVFDIAPNENTESGVYFTIPAFKSIFAKDPVTVGSPYILDDPENGKISVYEKYVCPSKTTCTIEFIIGTIADINQNGNDVVNQQQLKSYIEQRIPSFPAFTKAPYDGAAYGIPNGTVTEWSSFFMRLCEQESSFRNSSTGDHGNSKGLFQLSQVDGTNWKFLNGGQPLTDAQLHDPYFNTDAALKIINYLVRRDKYIKIFDLNAWPKSQGWGGAAAYFGSIRNNDGHIRLTGY